MCRRPDQNFFTEGFSDRCSIKGLPSQMDSIGAGCSRNISAIVDQQACVCPSRQLACSLNQLEQDTRGQLLLANLN